MTKHMQFMVFFSIVMGNWMGTLVLLLTALGVVDFVTVFAPSEICRITLRSP